MIGKNMIHSDFPPSLKEIISPLSETSLQERNAKLKELDARTQQIALHWLNDHESVLAVSTTLNDIKHVLQESVPVGIFDRFFCAFKRVFSNCFSLSQRSLTLLQQWIENPNDSLSRKQLVSFLESGDQVKAISLLLDCQNCGLIEWKELKYLLCDSFRTYLLDSFRTFSSSNDFSKRKSVNFLLKNLPPESLCELLTTTVFTCESCSYTFLNNRIILSDALPVLLKRLNQEQLYKVLKSQEKDDCLRKDDSIRKTPPLEYLESASRKKVILPLLFEKVGAEKMCEILQMPNSFGGTMLGIDDYIINNLHTISNQLNSNQFVLLINNFYSIDLEQLKKILPTLSEKLNAKQLFDFLMRPESSTSLFPPEEWQKILPALVKKLNFKQLHKLLKEPIKIEGFLYLFHPQRNTPLHEKKNLETVVAFFPEKLSFDQLKELLQISNKKGDLLLSNKELFQVILKLFPKKLSFDQLKELLQAQGDNGSTLLHKKECMQEIFSLPLKILSSKQLFEILKTEDHFGFSPLYFKDMLQAVLQLPPNKLSADQLFELLKIENKDGNTPLHYCDARIIRPLFSEKLNAKQLDELLQIRNKIQEPLELNIQHLEPKKAPCDLSFSEELALLKENIVQGKTALPLTIEEIESSYPDLAWQIANSPEKKAAFYALINEFQVKKALKNLKQFQLGSYRKIFLKKFGYNIADDDNLMEESYKLASENLLFQSKDVEPETFKKLLKEELIQVPLQRSGFPKELYEHYGLLFAKMNDLAGKIRQFHKQQEGNQIFKACTEQMREKFPKFANYLDREKNYAINEKQKKIAAQLLDKVLEITNSLEELSLEALEEILEKHSQEILQTLDSFEEIEKEIEQDLLKQAHFYEFLASTVPSEGVFEYRQGEEGVGTILGGGVCFGLCVDHLIKFLENPDRALKEQEELSISSKARFFQATHGLSLDNLRNKDTLQRDLIKFLVAKKPIEQRLRPLFNNLQIDLDRVNDLLKEKEHLLSHSHKDSKIESRLREIQRELQKELFNSKNLRERKITALEEETLFSVSQTLPYDGRQFADSPKIMQMNALGLECDSKKQILLKDRLERAFSLKDEIFQLLNNGSNQKEANYLLSLSRAEEAHALYLHFDEERNRYIFFDPNFGTFENRFQNREEGVLWLTDTLIECIKQYRHYSYFYETLEIKHFIKIENAPTP